VYRTRSTVDDIEMTFDLTIYNRMLSSKVSEVMNTGVLSIDQRKTCRDAVAVFLDNHIASLPVVDRQHRVVGIISETDLIAATNLKQRISDVLTKEVVTVHPDSRIGPVVRLFQEKLLRYIPVVDEKRRLVGIVGRRDILAHYSRTLASNVEGP
jgi:predicted transcriptional regulator